MNIVAIYPGASELTIGWHTNGQLAGTAAVPYPECSCEIGDTVETICDTLGVENVDMGITCYGMLEQSKDHIVELTPEVVDGVCQAKHGFDKTNYGIIMLASIGAKKMVCAYPLTYDILPEMMRLSGIPQIERKMVGHTLDHILARKHFEKETGKNSAIVTCYLSNDEISVASWKDGKLMDMTDSWDGEGPMTPTRSGFFHQRCVYKMSLSGKFDKETLLSKIRFVGGLTAHLGTSDLSEVRRKISEGDAKAKLVYETMVYQIAKSLGKLAVSCGKPDGITFIGQLATDEKLIADISSYVSYIGKIVVTPQFNGTDILIGSITNHG